MTALAWIGQGGYILEHCGARLVIDPYLSDVVERREGLTRICPRVASVDTLHPDYLFFSADTLLHEGLAPAVRAAAPDGLDFMSVCINGRLGNMGVADAIRLVSELRPRLSVPAHYGMFAENTADPAPFLAGCKALGLDAITLVPGRPVLLGGAPRPR